MTEAAQDLYAGPWRPGGTIAGAVAGAALMALLGFAFELDLVVAILAGAVVGAVAGTLFLTESFVRVTLPLSLPGVFAGSLLVMIPALGRLRECHVARQSQHEHDRQRHPEPLPDQR